MRQLFALGQFLTLGTALAIYGLVALTLQPTPSRPADGDPSAFSAERAHEVLADLLGDEQPHPMGSPAHALVRERIKSRLAELGYEPEEQTAAAFRNRRGNIKVRNVLATLPGKDPTGVVMLNAHYDSVRAGPGASDDGVAVAALLEVARILKAGPPLRNTILFLIDDGEEMGLRGARAFCRDHPLRDQVRVVCNFEARGTSGPSLMFETSGDNAWMVDAFATADDRPVAGSLFATIYEMLPNDTNLTVYRDAGIPGLNFAFIGDPQRYHTAEDSLANVSLDSMQHHGDHALAMARAFGELDLGAQPPGDAVFFDAFATVLIRWPAQWSTWLAVALTLAVLSIGAAALRRKAATGFGWGSLTLLLAIALPVGAGYAGAAAMRAIGWLEDDLVGNTTGYSTCYWALSLLGFFAATSIARRRCSPWAMWTLTWTLTGALACASAMLAVGTCYVFLFPLLFAVLGAAPAALQRREPSSVAMLLPIVASGIAWFPLHQFLPVALGVGSGWILTATHAVFLTSVLPVRQQPAAN